MLKLIPPDGKKYKCYYIRGTIAKGRRIFESTGTAKRREAELIFEKKQKDWLNGKLDLHVKTFADACVDYIEDINPGQSQREAVIGADNTDGSLRPCLLTYLGRVEDCREIDQDMVREVIRKHFKTNRHGKPYSPGTIVRQLIQPLTAVLNHAAPKYCDKPEFKREKYNDARERYGTDQECAAILKASAPHAAPIFLFAMYIGDRIGESVDLQIEDVFLDKSWAVLRDTKDCGKSRGIALHDQIVEVLRKVIGERKTGPVFLTDDGQQYKTYPKKAWVQACERAGVADFRLHDLRHTFGTNADIAGMTQRQREKQMGHANGSVNGRYVHVPDEELVKAINRIPWRDYEYHTDYREWARSGYGKADKVRPTA
jgi:integrase/recombinase XerD